MKKSIHRHEIIAHHIVCLLTGFYLLRKNNSGSAHSENETWIRLRAQKFYYRSCNCKTRFLQNGFHIISRTSVNLCDRLYKVALFMVVRGRKVVPVNYGIILLDMENHKFIDLLPNIKAKAIEAYERSTLGLVRGRIGQFSKMHGLMMQLQVS